MKRRNFCVAGLTGTTVMVMALIQVAVASSAAVQGIGGRVHPTVFSNSEAGRSGPARHGVSTHVMPADSGIEGTMISAPAGSNDAWSLAESQPSRASHVIARYVSAAGHPDAAPNCGKGVRPRKVVGQYKAKRHNKAGYRTDTLYCGSAKYGYRHLQPHISQYFGGWGNFNFSIGAVLKAPADWVVQTNGNFRESAPIYQCFFAGYYVIWTFYVVPTYPFRQHRHGVRAQGQNGRSAVSLADRRCPGSNPPAAGTSAMMWEGRPRPPRENGHASRHVRRQLRARAA
jgi:hypothetical protein